MSAMSDKYVIVSVACSRTKYPVKIHVVNIDLGVQQCFGVVYHELTTLRRVYFARAALAVRAK